MSRNHALRWSGSCLAVAVALLNTASAQESSKPAPEPPGAVELDSTEEIQLSPAQMTEASPRILSEIRSSAQRVDGMLTDSKEAGDVSKVLCLDPLAGEIQIADQAAQDRSKDLASSLERSDLTRARFEFTLLTVVRDRVLVVAGQANSCIGEETGFTGDSAVEVEVDPNLPETDAEQVADVPAVVDVEPNIDSAAE